jgi:hypothetical protein
MSKFTTTLRRISPNKLDVLIKQARAEEWTKLALLGPNYNFSQKP